MSGLSLSAAFAMKGHAATLGGRGVTALEIRPSKTSILAAGQRTASNFIVDKAVGKECVGTTLIITATQVSWIVTEVYPMNSPSVSSLSVAR